MWDLGTLDGDPGSTSAALGINDRGQIVGESYSHVFGTHAAYFSRSSGVIDLGTLGGLSSANAVNNIGQVVGYSSISSSNHAFVTDLDTMHMVDLNSQIPPGSDWLLFNATAINDAGQIAGDGDINGEIHAYLLTPDQNAFAPPIPLRVDEDQHAAGPINTADSNGQQPHSGLAQPILEKAQAWKTNDQPVACPICVLAGLPHQTVAGPPFVQPLEDPL
jgi:probable HAF family extracellular repeat protein